LNKIKYFLKRSWRQEAPKESCGRTTRSKDLLNLPDMLSLSYPAVSGQFQLEPLNSTVLQGSDAQFNASVQGKWNIMTWEVRGFLVLTFPFTGNVISSSKQFSANFCSSVDTSCVAFTIHNVTRGGQAGPVVCTIQGDYGSRTAQLYVQGRVVIR